MIAICAAMDRELAALRRRLRSDGRAGERAGAGGYPVWRGLLAGRPVLLCRTGLGRRADSAARALLDEHEPWLLVSAGLAGALDPDYRRGDLVLCESVAANDDAGGRRAVVHSDRELLDRAVAEAARAAVPVRIGRALTVDDVVATAEEKSELRRSTGADIVEMESYWLGRLAREKGLPFLVARAVLDDAGDELPDVPGLVRPDGSLNAVRALARPGALPALLRLALAERRALANLSRFLTAFAGALEMPPVGKPA